MSSIEKLLIRGVRSFSPSEENVIEFYHPLTLIVGPNGAGKTTVIECLKYACTGDLPPNSKGGAWVHDPKVKLKFKNVKGQPMVLTRSLQATQRKSKIEQKTLESLLSTYDPATGKQVSISGRCAELDEEVPQQLGVSPAVLDAVIFCHQEEAGWPLSEPAVLKKRFDEIFAATRYTKALESLKALRKELMQQLKLEQQKLDHLKQDRDKADRLRATAETTERRRQEAQEQVTRLTGEMEACSQQINTLSEQLKQVSEHQAHLQRLQHDLDLTRRSRLELEQSGMKVLSVDEAELDRLAAALQTRMGQADGHAEGLRKEKGLVDANVATANQQVQQLMAQQAARAAEQALMAERECSVQQATMRLSQMLGSSQDMSSIEQAQQRLKDELSLHLSRTKQQDTVAMEEVQAAMAKLSAQREQVRAKQALLEELVSKEAYLVEQIASIADSAAALENIRRQLTDHEAMLTASKNSLAAAAFDQGLQSLTMKRRSVEQEQQRLQQDLMTLARLTEQKQVMLSLKANAEQQQSQVDALWAEVSAELPAGLRPEEAELEVDRLWRAKERALKQGQSDLERLRSAQASAETRLSDTREQRRNVERSLSIARQAIEAAGVPVSGYENAMRECEKELQSLSLILSSQAIFQSYLDSLKAVSACPLCERPCHEQENAHLESKLKAQLDAKMQERRQQVQGRCEQLKSLSTHFADLERLEGQLSQLELGSREAALSAATRDLETAQTAFNVLVAEEKKFALLKRKVDAWWSARSSLSWSRVEQAEAEYRQAMAESGLLADSNASQIQERLACLQAELRQVTINVDKLAMDQRNQQAEVARREAAVRDARESLLRLQLRQTEASRLETELAEIKERLVQAKSDIEAAKALLSSLEPEVEMARQKRQHAFEEASKREETLRRDVEETGRLLRQVQEVNRELQVFAAKDNVDYPLLLAQAQERLEDLQHASAMLAEEIQLQGKQVSEVLVEQRTIGDNRRLRTMLKREEELNREIAAFPVQVATDLPAQLSRMQLRLSDLMGARAGLVGECRQFEEQGERLRQELQSDYPQVESNYRGQFVRVAAQQAACDDLERYAHALDQAIMRYHAYKMDEVNRIIREIWSTTYQGADIDTIEIRADHELVSGHRSYNYRVVMLKGDCELDMRGRSSAGQRVLASLIIRLALAETFAQHCACLALDEPTTNLDEANIAALAEALAQIIRLRGRDGRFQLIIITHDETFVEMLGRHECADWYWRVAKDEHQCSQIERQSFHGYE